MIFLLLNVCLWPSSIKILYQKFMCVHVCVAEVMDREKLSESLLPGMLKGHLEVFEIGTHRPSDKIPMNPVGQPVCLSAAFFSTGVVQGCPGNFFPFRRFMFVFMSLCACHMHADTERTRKRDK